MPDNGFEPLSCIVCPRAGCYGLGLRLRHDEVHVESCYLFIVCGNPELRMARRRHMYMPSAGWVVAPNRTEWVVAQIWVYVALSVLTNKELGCDLRTMLAFSTSYTYSLAISC